MKTTILLTLLSFSVFAQEVKWLNNIEIAKAESQEKRKVILLKFSGSDWCANCKRLDKSFFESEAFKSFAQDNLILLEADFPMSRKNKLSKEQQAHNDELADKFNKSGAFPLVIILNEKGELLGKVKTPQNNIEDYIKQIENFTSK
jgi:thioredoxin-related protein